MSDRMDRNKPIEEYDHHDWGKTKVSRVDPIDEGIVVLDVVRYDPQTAERVADTTEVLSIKQLREQKRAYEEELAKIEQRLAYAQAAVDAETVRLEEEELARQEAEATRLAALSLVEVEASEIVEPVIAEPANEPAPPTAG